MSNEVEEVGVPQLKVQKLSQLDVHNQIWQVATAAAIPGGTSGDKAVSVASLPAVTFPAMTGKLAPAEAGAPPDESGVLNPSSDVPPVTLGAVSVHNTSSMARAGAVKLSPSNAGLTKPSPLLPSPAKSGALLTLQRDVLPLELPAEEVRRVASHLHLLSLCGGPDKTQGLDKCVASWGAKCTVFDTEISAELDLVDEGLAEAKA